jgi:hypothetical protein
VSIFQYHTKLCFKCSIWLVTSLDLTAICWRIEPSSCSMLLSPWHSWIKIHVYVLHHWYQATQNSRNTPSTFSLCFWPVIICAGNGYLEIVLSKTEQKILGSINSCLNQTENLNGYRCEVTMREKHCRDAISSISRLLHTFWVNSGYKYYR